MVHDVRPLAPVQRGDRRHRPAGADDPVAAPPPVQRLEPEPLAADPVAVQPRSRAATTISNPASRAARAIGSRCDQKYQSSVTRKISFGRCRAAAAGRSQRPRRSEIWILRARDNPKLTTKQYGQYLLFFDQSTYC